jgi:hypothetical protein
MTAHPLCVAADGMDQCWLAPAVEMAAAASGNWPLSPETRETWVRSPIRLALLQPGACVVCAVADPSRRTPVLKESGHLAETGRGLHVISALADEWGYTVPGDSGKVVWAMFSSARL